jgi:hypothetical protein
MSIRTKACWCSSTAAGDAGSTRLARRSCDKGAENGVAVKTKKKRPRKSRASVQPGKGVGKVSTVSHRAARPVVWGLRALAGVFGFGVAVALAGFVRELLTVFGPSPGVATVVLAVILGAGGIGPFAARRLALRVVLRRQGRSRGRPGAGAPVAADRAAAAIAAGELPWLVQSVLGVLVGAGLLIGLGLTGVVPSTWRFLMARFFWTPAAEWLLVSVLVAFVLAVPGLALGVQFAALQAVALRVRSAPGSAERPRSAPGRRKRAPPRAGNERAAQVVRSARYASDAVAIALIGMAAGWAVVTDPPLGQPIAAGRWILTGATCMFAVALISALLTRWFALGTTDPASETGEGGEPGQSSDPAGAPSPRLLFVALVGWGAACALWIAGACADGGATDALGLLGHPAVCLVALAAGVWLAVVFIGRRRFSAAGYGVTLGLGGAAILLAVAVQLIVPGGRAQALARVAIGLALGAGLPYGERACLRRSVSERVGIVRWVGLTLVGAALGVVAAAAMTTGSAAPLAAVAAACLLLLVLGGLLQIHDSEGAPRPRRQRLSVTFTSLCLAVVVLPLAAERAARVAAGNPTRSPGAAAQRAERVQRVVRAVLETGPLAVPPGARVAWLSDTAAPTNHGGLYYRTIRWNRTHGTEEPAACVWWRAGRDAYDVIVQHVEPGSTARTLAWEWLDGLRSRLLARGVFVMGLPIDRLGERHLRTAVDTFRDVFRDRDVWLLLAEDAAGVDAAYLMASAHTRDLPRALDFEVDGGRVRALRAADVLSGRRPDAPLHTLRAPRIQLTSPAVGAQSRALYRTWVVGGAGAGASRESSNP